MKKIIILFLLILSAATIFAEKGVEYSFHLEGECGLWIYMPYAQGNLVNRFSINDQTTIDLSCGVKFQSLYVPRWVSTIWTLLDISVAYKHVPTGLGISLSYLGMPDKFFSSDQHIIKSTLFLSPPIKEGESMGHFFKAGFISQFHYDSQNKLDVFNIPVFEFGMKYTLDIIN